MCVCIYIYIYIYIGYNLSPSCMASTIMMPLGAEGGVIINVIQRRGEL